MSKNKQSDAKRPAFHEAFAEKIIKHLEEGTAPWQKPWQPGKALVVPNNPQSGTVYKGMNRVSLGLAMLDEGYDDPRWLTLKQANDMGLRIKKGSRSEAVVYYQFTKEQERLDDDGKPVLGLDGNPVKETVRLDRPIMRGAHVFNGQQIEGMPPLDLTDKAFEWDPVEKAENILSASGATIKHDQSNRAFYRPSTDSIHLPPRENFEEPGRYYGTALHELGHWTGHSSRMEREFGPFGSEPYAREELRAEIASWMLGEDIGIPHEPGQHAAYVKSWIEALKKDPYEIVRACRDAEQIKGYVMGLEQRKELAQEKTVAPPEKKAERDQGIAAMGLPANPAKEKVFLDVPYAEKNEAKALGAKWDRNEKSWFIPPGVDQTPFEKWQNPHQVEFDRVYGMDRAGLIAEANKPELYDKSTFELKLLSDRLQTELDSARKEVAALDGGRTEKTVADISGGYERTLRVLLFKQEQEREQAEKALEQAAPSVLDAKFVEKLYKEQSEICREEIRASESRIQDLEKQIERTSHPIQKNDLLEEVYSEQKVIGRFRGELEKLERGRAESLEQKSGIANLSVPPVPALEKIYLNIPPNEKAHVMRGAQWDKDKKLWFAPEGVDLAPLKNWLPIELVRSVTFAEPDALGRRHCAQLKRSGMGWEHINGPDGKPVMFGTEREAQDFAQLSLHTPSPERLKPAVPPQEEFATALEAAGLDLGDELPIMDGQIHRVPLQGDKPGTLNASYSGHADGVPNGWADNFKTGERLKWTGNGHTLTDEQKTQMREQAAFRKEERMREVAERHNAVAEHSRDFYEARPPAHSDHAYLVDKGIPSDQFRVSPTGKELVVPLINTDGDIRSLQFIGEDGTKRFMPGGEKKGCFFLMGADIKDGKNLASGEILLAEGVATGASLQAATGKPVAVAFDAGNLEAVAVKLREKFPNAAITICADNDHKVTRNDTLYNVGVEKAKAAAQRVGGTVKVPEFSKEEKAKGLTDFNDLHKARGLDTVRRQVGGKSLARDSGLSR